MANYVKLPGGVVLDLADGSSEVFPYGAKVDEDRLAEHQRANYKDFCASSPRSESPESIQLAEAHRRAAEAEGGQINSTSSTVPANYEELDTAGAVALVRALEAHPAEQAAILVHERINQAREKVIDVASDEARRIAGEMLDSPGTSAMADIVAGDAPPTPAPAPTPAPVQTTSTPPATPPANLTGQGDGGGSDDDENNGSGSGSTEPEPFNRKALETEAKELGIGGNISNFKDDTLVKKVEEARAASGGSGS